MARDESLSSLRDQTQRFLSDFFAKGEVLVRELIEENERLRARIADPSTPPPMVSEEVVQRLMTQVAELERECAEIRRLAGSMERQSGGYRRRLDELEQEHYHLAAMYVAAGQFHGAGTIDDVLRTVTEILLNFVGVGRFRVLGLDEERGVLFPLVHEGTSGAVEAELSLAGTGLSAAARPWRTGDPLRASAGASMHLPLASTRGLVGVVRIESFLPQKREFVDTDFALLELVSEHAGIAIENAWVRSNAGREPMRRAALERLVKP
jgi:GAF domain-containing protein